MNILSIKKHLLFFCLILINVILTTEILTAQTSTEDASLQKQNAGQFDQRSNGTGGVIKVDGNMNISPSNGNITYSYPISNRTIQGFPMTTTLNYCGSIGFTAFGDYRPRASIDGYDEVYDHWEQFHQTRSAWILGFNGFAVQLLGINKMYCINPYLSDSNWREPEKTNSLKFEDNILNWAIEGYDYCNRMQYLWLDNEQDVIKILRADGSVLELRNGNVPHEPLGSYYSINRPDLFTGHYYVNEANSKGFGIVEYSNKYVQTTAFRYPNYEYYMDVRPRILHYFPGDGLEYVFHEWVAPFGRQHPNYSAYLPEVRSSTDITAAGVTALLLGSKFGGYTASPTIFYLDEVKDGAITLTSFKHSRHSSSPFTIPTDNVDSTKGRASLTEFDGHKLTYNYKSLTIEALGRTITIGYDSVTKDGFRKPTDYPGIPWWEHDNFTLAQKTAKMSVFDNEQYRSYLGMVTSIVDPTYRETKFGYENYYRKYLDTRFVSYSPGNVLNFKNYRMTSITEPNARYTIHYNSDVATERSYTGTAEMNPFVQKNITNIVDEVKKFSKEASPTDTTDYLTKTNYIFEEDDIFNLSGNSLINTYDKITGLSSSNTFHFKKYEVDPFIFDYPPVWRTPTLKYTALEESSESAGGITTILKSHTDTSYYGMGSRYLNLPKTEEVLVVNTGTGDTIRKSYKRYGYSFSTVRTYDSNTYRGMVPENFGKEVATDTVFVYRPDDISGSPLFYKTNTYLHLPLTHDNIDIIDSIWLKDESIKKYNALRLASDADVIGKTWEQTLCDSRMKTYRFDTLDNVSVAIPPHFGLPMKMSLYENSTLLQGKTTEFNTAYSSSDKPLFTRGLAKSDTVISKNGTRKILNGLYDYSKVNRRGGGLLSTQKNANGAKHELFYEYNQPIAFSVAPGESCPGYIMPTAFRLDNTNTVDTALLTEWVNTSYLYEAPFAEQSKVRKYKIGVGDTARLDSSTISQVYERGYFGQVISSVSPNGWLSKYIYDNNGRIQQVHLPGDFSSAIPEDLTESYRGIADIRSSAGTGVSYYLDSVHCTNSPKTRTFKTFAFIDTPDNDFTKLYVSREAPHHKPCPCGDPEDSSGIHFPTARKGGAIPLETIDHCNVWIIQDFDVTHYADILFDIDDFNKPGSEIDSVIFRIHVTGVTGDFVNLKLFFPQLDTTIYYLLNASDATDSSTERKFLTVNLTSKLGQLTTLASADSDLVIKASTSTIGGSVSFANDASDTYPALKLYGKFRTTIADYTLKYSYTDRIPSPLATVLTKTDDKEHTSNNWNEDIFVRRWSAISQFGANYQIKKSTLNIGTLSDYHTDSVLTAYSGLGKPISITNQEGFTVHTGYDACGRPDTIINEDNTQRTMSYDFGIPSDYNITDSSYYGFCSKKMSVDEKGLEIRQYFDAFDRLRKEIVDSGSIGSHLNLTTKYEYDILGRLKKVTNPQNQTTTYWYNDFGYVKYKYQPDMGVLSYSYDNMGNTRFTQTQEQSSNNKFTYYEYDDLNRVTVVGEAGITKTIYPDTTLPITDTLNLHRWTDSLDATVLHDNNNSAILTANKTLWKNLAFGVPVVPAVAQPANHPIFSMCMANEPYYPETTPPVFPVLQQGLYSSTAANPYSTTTSNFEDISTHPEFVRMVTQYDELPQKAGAVWSNFTPTDRAGVWDSLAPKGKVRNLKGQQAAVAYRDKYSEPFHYQVYSYDERGRVEALLRFTENLGYDAVYYKYNSANQVIQQTAVDSWRQSVTWYGYDYNGRIDTVWSKITANGTGLLHGSNTSSLDSLKRPFPVTKTSDCAQMVYRYNKRGMIDSMVTIKPGLNTQYTYNSRGFLDSLVCTEGAGNVFKEKLDYDVDGQIVTQHWKQGAAAEDSMNYIYDHKKQLIQWINVAATGTYTYDYAGNRLTGAWYNTSNGITTTSTYNHEFGNNRLTSRNRTSKDTTTYTFFKDGSMKSSVYKEYTGAFWNNKTEIFGYGYNGLLTTYTLGNGFSMNVNCYTDGGDFKWDWEYRYSPKGERESKRLTSSPLGDGYASHNWNYYLLGENRLQLATYNGRETTRSDCFSSGHRVYFYPSEYLTYGYANSALLTTRADGKQEYKITDHLGSIRAIVDSTGYVLSHYDYEPFGKVLTQIGADSRKSFIDKEKDYENGLGDFGVRKYDDTRGAFTSIDPLWERCRGFSPYHYSYNNPLQYKDGNGKWPSYANAIVKWCETTPGYQHIFTSHEEILYKALSGTASPTELKQIIDGQAVADVDQRTEVQFAHAMNNECKFYEFINKEINEHGDPGEGTLAARLHAITDLTSPMHEGFQIWDNPNILQQAWHVLGERHDFDGNRVKYAELLAGWYYNWDKNGTGQITSSSFSTFSEFNKTGIMTFRVPSNEVAALVQYYKDLGYTVLVNGVIQ